ncbi:hypothetical protein HF888_02405 [Bermanella marisrubri]|uniref:Uncharacterized protein n=1 Tax=Bermanella marisrubri TaxID=207949 RepID=Q1N3P6_9GAMM|nr:hypothetical protein [Bermanella marisrubri]EAT12828.1 hypothetical protein RED65_12184 [Oceanobacter sp. RED65] [Bermanella marisrubri]QIZ83150.1 hypothetical protein HF888_02405 [Bermanella marisrubri]
MRILLCAIIFCLSFSAYSNEYLLRHIVATSQAMSSLYMKGLSQGSNRYEKDFVQYRQNAQANLQMLQQEDNKLFQDLSERWQLFSDKLALTYSEEYGWDIDSAIRRDFRGYLSNTYEIARERAQTFDSEILKRLYASVQVEAMVARFLDIASTYNGTFSLSLSDAEKLDIQQANEIFKSTLEELKGQSSAEKNMQTAARKWEFVEKNVIGEASQGAFFLVYATKTRITNILIPSLNTTVSSDF